MINNYFTGLLSLISREKEDVAEKLIKNLDGREYQFSHVIMWL